LAIRQPDASHDNSGRLSLGDYRRPEPRGHDTQPRRPDVLRDAAARTAVDIIARYVGELSAKQEAKRRAAGEGQGVTRKPETRAMA